MAFHLCGFFKSVPAGAAPTLLDPISDDVFATDGQSIVSSTENSVFAALATGVTLNRAAVIAPPVRCLVRPMNTWAAMQSNPNLAEWLDAPLSVLAGEGISCDAVHTSGGPTDQYVLLWLAPEFERAPQGAALTIRGTNTSTTTTANVWTDVPITWDTRLAFGRYAVVAGELISATGPLAFRWKFDTQSYRPGGVSMPGHGDRTHPYLYQAGKLGTWGYIRSQVMPRLQVLSTVAAAQPHTVYLQVVRVD